MVRRLNKPASTRGNDRSSTRGGEIIASFADGGQFISSVDVKPLSKIVIDDYLAKKYDKVVAVYTDYISTVVQQTRIRQILPISKIDIEKQIAEMDVIAKEYGLDEPVAEYKVEPNPREVLILLCRALLRCSFFTRFWNRRPEQSARMMAMRNATDAAGEMSDDLTLAYNQIRQGRLRRKLRRSAQDGQLSNNKTTSSEQRTVNNKINNLSIVEF